MISFSKAAIRQLANISKDHQVKRILFSIEGGGCNGFKYLLKPMKDTPHSLDEMVLINSNLDVIVDRHSIMYLIGTKIDWKEDVMGAQFVFENPNASGACGCGSTFSV